MTLEGAGRYMAAHPIQTALTVFLAIVAALSTFTYFRLDDTRDAFFASACQRDPASKQCAEIRREIARSEPLRNPCISFRRVIPNRIYQQFTKCPQELERKRNQAGNPEGSDQRSGGTDGNPSPSPTGSDSTQGSTGGSVSGGSSGGASGGSGDGGGSVTPPPSEPPPSEPPPTDPPPPPPPPRPPDRPSLGDNVGGIVDGAVGTADDATGGTVCRLRLC